MQRARAAAVACTVALSCGFGLVVAATSSCDATYAPDGAATAARGDGGGSDDDARAPSLQPPGWDDELRVPELADTNPDPGVVEVSLETRPARVTIDGRAIEMWTYEGRVPGPTIHAKKGDRVVVHVHNALPEPTTVHWHGVRVPNAMDGVPDAPTPPIAPGASFEYAFTVRDAGTFWYHPHFASSGQVGFGLYGALVVDDPASPVHADELVLVLSDASVEDAGALEPEDAGGYIAAYFGREGNVALVNGRTRARLGGRPGVPQRWRVINASRAHYANLQIPGADVTRLGGDEGLAAAPSKLVESPPVVPVSPGERVELWVVPRTTSTVTWEVFDRFHNYPAAKSVPVIDLAVDGEAVKGMDAPPAKLASIEPLSAEGAATTRTVHFTDSNGMLGIDGKVGADVPMLHAAANTTEVWTIANDTGQDHPFHLHGFGFQVLALGTSKPRQLEWRDTVNVPARGRIQIAIPFDDRTGTWMYHCHILDHADIGMMGMLMLM